MKCKWYRCAKRAVHYYVPFGPVAPPGTERFNERLHPYCDRHHQLILERIGR